MKKSNVDACRQVRHALERDIACLQKHLLQEDLSQRKLEDSIGR